MSAGVIGLAILAGHNLHAQTQDAVAEGVSQFGNGAATSSRGGFSSEGSDKQRLTIEPRIDVVETYSDNAFLSSTDRRSEFITEVSPGIRISGTGRRIRGVFDYALRRFMYANGSAEDNTQHNLSSFATIEAVDSFAYIDLAGNVSRQAISAFSTQTGNTSQSNSNLTQVANYSVSPYLKGDLKGNANYELRYRRSIFKNDSTVASNSLTDDWLGAVGQDYFSKRFGWLAQISRTVVSYDVGRDTKANQIRGVLNSFPNPQLKLYISGGSEENNYLTLESKRYTNYGVGFAWRLNERTRVEAEQSHRFFGNGHKIVFAHSSAKSATLITDSKDVVINSNTGASGSGNSLYDLLFSQFAAMEPDATRRAQLVDSYIRANGLNRDTVIGSSFLSNTATLQRLQQASVSFFGIRSAVSLFLSKTQTQSLGNFNLSPDSGLGAQYIRQNGFGGAFSRKLTPTSSINFLASIQRASGVSTSQKSKLQFYSVTYTKQIAPTATLGFGLRRSIFDAVSGYRELAAYGSVSFRF